MGYLDNSNLDQQVISNCALVSDLKILPSGDATEIGEKVCHVNNNIIYISVINNNIIYHLFNILVIGMSSQVKFVPPAWHLTDLGFYFLVFY